MEMILLVIVGAAGGALGGMGMGGGTLLIPLLSLLCGFVQHSAQAANLVAFIPMSAVSITLHLKSGLVRPKYFFTVALPAAASSAGASFLAMNARGEFLGKAFGIFLIAVAVSMFVTGLTVKKEEKPIPLGGGLRS